MSFALLLLGRRPKRPREPSTALTNLRAAVDGLESAIVRVENAIEAGADARLACIGITLADVATIGTSHRRSAIEVTASVFALTKAVNTLNACQQHSPRPDEREAASRCLRRIVALQARMHEVLGTTTALSG